MYTNVHATVGDDDYLKQNIHKHKYIVCFLRALKSHSVHFASVFVEVKKEKHTHSISGSFGSISRIDSVSNQLMMTAEWFLFNFNGLVFCQHTNTWTVRLIYEQHLIINIIFSYCRFILYSLPLLYFGCKEATFEWWWRMCTYQPDGVMCQWAKCMPLFELFLFLCPSLYCS